jgi:hypothetical protein
MQWAIFLQSVQFQVGPYSLVGTATSYGLDGPGIESRWGRDFSHTSRPVLGPTSLLYNGYRVFPGNKAAGTWCWPPTHSLLAPRSRVCRTLPLTPILGFRVCYGVLLPLAVQSQWNLRPHTCTTKLNRLLPSYVETTKGFKGSSFEGALYSICRTGYFFKTLRQKSHLQRRTITAQAHSFSFRLVHNPLHPSL